ncbi:MAG TPA: ABC transporter ATP-binding protein [Burkholderiales bacterium]|nr:ABC transporter ATP-binding protein [Burkholderiales bacterium]
MNPSGMPGTVASILDARGVVINYQRSNTPALEHMDLSLRAGELFCLIGPSGCGKTTMLSAFAGFVPVVSGSMLLRGRQITGPGPDRGVVFQDDDALFGWLTTLENVEFGMKVTGVPRAERRARAEHYVNLVGLGGHENKLPHELSGGMRKRVQIARVLANEPDVLLMDEPFAALDAQARAIMQVELERIWSATRSSVLFITHDIEEAIVLGDRVGVMTNGPRARMREIVEIDLPRPRERASRNFTDVLSRCLTIISEEVARSSFGEPRSRAR